MAARSYPVSVIAQELGMKESTIYRLLGSNEEIWDEINTIIANLFAEGDRMLANLRTKALIKLDEQLESTDPDLREETLEAWRLKWECLAKGFMNYLQDRFASIEQRLDRLEQQVEERHV